MTDDIVTRLQKHCDTSHIPNLPCDWLGTKCFNCESADEIERLGELLFQEIYYGQEKLDEIELLRKERDKWKSLCEGIVEAITNEGREPFVHRRIIAKHRSEWMTLWERIDKAIKAVTNGK